MKEVFEISLWTFTIQLLENLCVLFTLITLFSQYAQLRLEINLDRKEINWAGILMFALLSAFTMGIPIQSSPEGVIFDLRLAVVILGSLYLGLRDGAILAILTIIIRCVVGGSGWILWAIPALLYGPVAYYIILHSKKRYLGLVLASTIGTFIYLLTLAALSWHYDWFQSISPYTAWSNFKVLAVSKFLCNALAVLLLDRALFKIVAMQKQFTNLTFLANTDDMTGLANHRRFQELLTNTLQDAAQNPVSVLMMDVDYFKIYNDTFGHQAGDVALKKVALAIKKCVRDSDIVGRYGGEEFIVVLPKTKPSEAFEIAERIRTSVQETQFLGRQVTVSIGVTTCSEADKSKENIIEEADTALYWAKNLGRNCVH
ncbi:GGDEF domain-containing protein [Sporomusa malonica]|uniref:5TMR of 5TMR-LYT n=1 Tax=Sporomusa malonica TaxID=112901 RepID=A0A1W2D854_9FIRM|nr:GGDEF domain-containing protein [Sporomusa malonica]SMC93563.1 5TMR of 5TMR-LYT [Sporomusa malonica]